MCTVETQLPCVVRLKGEDDEDSGPLLSEAEGGGYGDYGTGSALPQGMRLHASCVTPDDRKIFTVEGDMTEMRVDALVNTADKKLSLVGGLGKVIVTKGGKAVRDACAKYIRDYGILEEGSVFLSPGGDLNAASVIHVVGPAWQNGDSNEKARLKEAVSKVMKQATLKNASSIAIPAISCGTLGFPSKVATSVIVQAVQNYFREDQDCPIKLVYLCDVKQDTIEGFTEALKSCFGRVKMSPLKPRRSQSPQQGARPKAKPRPGTKPKVGVTGSDSDSGTDYEVVDEESDDDVQDSGSQDRPFGDIKVVVKSGDITREACDCIVNSSNKKLDLSRGGVSNAILKKGGKTLVDQLSKKRHKMGKYRITSTDAPGLQCSHIMHIVAEDSVGDWKKVTAKCLHYAEKKQMRCIAFPALGTGKCMKASDIAEVMVEALVEFKATRPKHVNEVRFVIFQSDMEQDFQRAVDNARSGKPCYLQQAWDGLKDLNEESDIKTPRRVVVASRVVDRGRHVVAKKQLSVSLQEPPDPLLEFLKQTSGATDDTPDQSDGPGDKQAKGKGKKSDPEPEKTPLRTIKVRGMKKVKSKETVQYYFENSRRSGGGQIAEMKSDEEDDNVVFISFESAEAAKKVSERASHHVDNCELSVSLYVPPPPRPIYEEKLLIKGIKPTTTKDCLFNFLEAKGGGVIPESQQQGEKDNVRLVTFQAPIDFDRLKQNARMLEGASLQLERVNVSNILYVANYDESMGKDTLELYFESETRSGGGQVEKVVCIEDEGYWLVYFADYQVIDNVLHREHKLGQNKLAVKLFVDCLGRPQGGEGESRFKIPDPVFVPDPNMQKIKFILNSKLSKDAIENQMSSCHTKVHWPKTDAKPPLQIELECTLTQKTKNCYKLSKEWKKNSLDNFQDYMKTIVLMQNSVRKDLWSDVVKTLQEITIENPEAVAVFVEKEQGNVTIVGVKRPAEQLSGDIKQRIKKINDAADLAKQRTKETLTNIHLIDTKMLLAIKYPTQMEEKYKDLKVKINQNKNEIAFDGLGKDIHAAKLDMYEMKDKFAKRTFKDIPPQSLGMYQTLKQVKEYIVKTLKQKNVPAVWDVEDDGLVVCSSSEETLGRSIEFIRDAVKETSLPLSKATRSIVNTDEWDNMKQNLQALHPGKVMINAADMSQVVISSTDDVEQETLKAVKKFLHDKAILDETVQLSASVSKLLSQHYRTEVDNIAKSLVGDHVQIIWSQNGFSIRGNEKGVADAKIQLQQLASKIISKDHTIDKPGSGQYFSQQTGRDNIRTVETQLPCVVRLKGEDDDDSGPFLSEAAGGGEGDYGTGSALPQGMRLHASCDTPDDRKIFTVEGDMTEMRVDALVNTADKKLSLVGGLGKVIVTKGGKAVRDACAKYIRDLGILEEGSVFLSPGGDLNAASVIHVVGPAWQNGDSNEKARLKEAVSKVMKQASLKHVSSIAIPAISCGTFGFPSKVATLVIVQAIQNYFREEQDCPIKMVYLCDVKQDTIEGFTEALKSCFGRVKMSPLKPRRSQSPQQGARPKAKPRPGAKPRMGVPVLPTGAPPSSKPPGAKAIIGNITVTIVKGELAKEKVNAIVNTTADNLDLTNGAVSKSLLTAAGKEIQDEVKANHPNKLTFGETVVTKGYNLSCDIVIHTALPNYDGGPSIQILQSVMDKCLKEASNQNFTKVAFPAIGTGNLKFPKDVVAKEMFKAVEAFNKKSPNSTISDVKFVVYHKDTPTVKAFEAEEVKWLSGKRVVAERQGRDFNTYQSYQEVTNTGNKQPRGEASSQKLFKELFAKTKKKNMFEGRIQEIDASVCENAIRNEKPFDGGGYGDVYLFRPNNNTEMSIVIKRIQCKDDAADEKSMSATCEMLAARLMHFGIVPLWASAQDTSNKTFYFILPYMENKSLAEKLKEDKKAIDSNPKGELTLDRVKRLRILYQVACALAFLHEEIPKFRGSYVHRDVITRNIVLDSKFNARLVDFGRAREYTPGKNGVTLQTPYLFGSKGYFQTNQPDKLTVEKDVFNFAIVILEVLSSHPPCLGDHNEIELRNKMDNGYFIEVLKTHIQFVWGAYTISDNIAVANDNVKTLMQIATNCQHETITSAKMRNQLEGHIRNKEFKHWEDPQAGRDIKNCVICLINPVIQDAQTILAHNEKCNLHVCAACMRNSYLNPIECHSCAERVQPTIGHLWEAILVAGNDVDEKDSAVTFKMDVDKVFKAITSRHPMTMGISKESVHSVCADWPGTSQLLLPKLIEKFNHVAEKKIHSLLFYFTGHHGTEKGFKLGDNDEHLTSKELEKYIEDSMKKARCKRVLVLLDCCEAPDIKLELSCSYYQINSCNMTQSTKFSSEEGSLMTEFFAHTLKGQSMDSENPCLLEQKQKQRCQVCKAFTSDNGFIKIEKLQENVQRHVNNYDKHVGNVGNNKHQIRHHTKGNSWEDAVFAYFIETLITFEFILQHRGPKHETQEVKHVVKQLPDKQEDLEKTLFIIYRDKFHLSKLKPENLTDIIAITFYTGPLESNKHELNTMEKIEAAWNAKRKLCVCLREIQSLHRGKVGVFVEPGVAIAVLKCFDNEDVNKLCERSQQGSTVLVICRLERDGAHKLWRAVHENAYKDGASCNKIWKDFEKQLEAIKDNKMIEGKGKLVFTFPEKDEDGNQITSFYSIHVEM